MKKIVILLCFCVFAAFGAGEIVAVPQSPEKTIKEDIMLVYGSYLNDAQIREKNGKIIIELDGRSGLDKRDFYEMAKDIKQKVNVILNRDCVVRYSAIGKFLHEQ